MTKENVGRRSVLETPRLAAPIPNLVQGQVHCLVCGQPGSLVPGSAQSGAGYLVRHPFRVFLCREQVPPDTEYSTYLELRGSLS